MRGAVFGFFTLGLIFITACGARQSSFDDGYPYATARHGRAAETSARVVCTPSVYLYADSSFTLVRTVCEVDEKLYREVERIWHGRAPAMARHHGAGASEIGFPGPDDWDVEDESGTSFEREVRAAVQRIIGLLDDPDPIAGVGNPGRANAYVRQLPEGVLLHVVDGLHERGRLDEIVAYARQQQRYDSRLDSVLAVHALAHPSPGEVFTPTDVAARLRALGPLARMYAARYLADQYSFPPEVELLIEGFLTFERAELEWRDPRVISSAGSPPSPIEPGVWAKPANEPAELYLGKEAHRIIAAYYEAANSTDIMRLNHTPISSILTELEASGVATKLYKLGVDQRALRPDILNLTQMHIYEIKPAGRMGEGISRALMYVGVLGKAGISVSLGPMGAPGTTGYAPAPGGVFIFYSMAPGVIGYQYRRGRLVPERVTAEQTETGNSWSWQLEPMTDQQRSVFLTTLIIIGGIIFSIVTAPASG